MKYLPIFFGFKGKPKPACNVLLLFLIVLMYVTNTKWVFKGKPEPAFSHLGRKIFFLKVFVVFNFFFKFFVVFDFF